MARSMVFITIRKTDIQTMELETMESRAINFILEVRVGGKPVELGKLTSVNNRLCYQVNQTVVHWVLYPLCKGI